MKTSSTWPAALALAMTAGVADAQDMRAGSCPEAADLGTLVVQDANGVSGMQCPGCSTAAGGRRYTFNSFAEALRLLYSGVHDDAAGARDCNSDVRHALADRWNEMIGGSCSGQVCSGLHRAFRGPDGGQESQALVEALGLGDLSRPFCNGVDRQDADPVRRTCHAREQVCGVDGTLGLVVPVVVPTTKDNNATCTSGAFRYTSTTSTTCPDGSNSLFGQCLTPVRRGAGGSETADCLNGRTNLPITSQGRSVDGRAYNIRRRNPDGSFKGSLRAFDRLHALRSIPNNESCRELDSVDQARCLLEASPCSVSFAGLGGIYAFSGAFNPAGSDSVDYGGQTLRHSLIQGIVDMMEGLTQRIEVGQVPDVTAEFMALYDSLEIAAEPISIETDPPVLQGRFDELASARTVRGKIAGNDPAREHRSWNTSGQFVGWSASTVTGPDSLVLHWVAQLAQAAIDRANGHVPQDPSGAPIPLVTVTETGLDLRQLLQKFLLMAVVYAQGSDDYLDEGLNGDHSGNRSGQPNSALEHGWDEAFGYFGSARTICSTRTMKSLGPRVDRRTHTAIMTVTGTARSIS